MTAQAVHDRGQPLLRQVVDAPERLRRVDAVRQRGEHVGLRAADARADESGDVPVTAVLAQHGRGMPQPGDRVARHRKGAHPGVHHPTFCGRANRGFGGQVGGAHQARGVGQLVAQDPPYGGGAAPLPRGNGRLGRDRLPRARDVPRGLPVGEAVEGRVHDLRRHPPQRRGPAGEVAVPVSAVAERGQLLVALVGEVGDQADRL